MTNRMLLEPRCTGLITKIRDPLCLYFFFGCFLLRLCRIKCSQVMFMGKFGPTALNFGKDFSIGQFFLGHPVFTIGFVLLANEDHTWKLQKEFRRLVMKTEWLSNCCAHLYLRLLQPRSEWTAEIASQSSFGKKWTVAPDCRQGAEISCLCHPE